MVFQYVPRKYALETTVMTSSLAPSHKLTSDYLRPCQPQLIIFLLHTVILLLKKILERLSIPCNFQSTKRERKEILVKMADCSALCIVIITLFSMCIFPS